MPQIELEDCADDILSKAYNGLCNDGVIFTDVERSAIEKTIDQARAGIAEKAMIEQSSKLLSLHAPSLQRVNQNANCEQVQCPEAITMLTLPFSVYTVNVFAIRSESGKTLLIDAGFVPSDLIQAVQTLAAEPEMVLITHAHRDHVGGVAALKDAYPGIKILANDPIKTPGSEAYPRNRNFQFENFEISVISIPGHAQDAVALHINSNAWNAVAVGDGIYARSAGKIPTGYRAAIRFLRDRILTLPEDSIILPGHGPMTTVQMEKHYNPFFAAII